MDKKNDTRKIREAEVLRSFVGVYCAGNHPAETRAGGPGDPCPECAALLAYALGRLERCPMDPKPKCKNCPVHCYKPDMRAKIREVMKYSGMHFVKRGRVDWLIKYFLM